MYSTIQQLVLSFILIHGFYLVSPQLLSNQQAIFCSLDERSDACSITYSPVCASSPQFCFSPPCPQIEEFSNNCEACRRVNVASYVPGRCYFTCEPINIPPSGQPVSDSPVCGYYRNGCEDSSCMRDFRSSTAACQDSLVVSFSNGPCTNNEGTTQSSEEEILLGEFILGEQETLNEELILLLNEELILRSNEEVAFPFNEELVFLLNEELVLSLNEELILPFNEELVFSFNEELILRSNEELILPTNEELALLLNEELELLLNEELTLPPNEELILRSNEELVLQFNEEIILPLNEEQVLSLNEELMLPFNEELILLLNEELILRSNEELTFPFNEELMFLFNEELVLSLNEELILPLNEELVNLFDEELVLPELSLPFNEEIILIFNEELILNEETGLPQSEELVLTLNEEQSSSEERETLNEELLVLLTEEEYPLQEESFKEEEMLYEEMVLLSNKEISFFEEKAILENEFLLRSSEEFQEFFLDESSFETNNIIEDKDEDVEVEIEEEQEEEEERLNEIEEGKEQELSEESNEYVSYNTFVCQVDLNKNCPPEYLPVCATTACSDGTCRKTFDNACFACMESKVLSYTPGTCEEERIKCDPLGMHVTPRECFTLSDPICVYPSVCLAEPCGVTAINPCQGCSWGGANYYTRGICWSDI